MAVVPGRETARLEYISRVAWQLGDAGHTARGSEAIVKAQREAAERTAGSPWHAALMKRYATLLEAYDREFAKAAA